MEEKIKGGYILLSRNIIESQIWQKPPEYLKIWIYILSRVNWKKSKNNDIGEDLFNFRQEKIPGVKLTQVYDFLRWARIANSRDLTTQITTQKTTRGIRIKVTKYAYYQDVKNYQFQSTFQDSFQHISNTIPKTLNNNTKEYIYNTHTSKKSVCEENKNLSAEDLIILKKYAKENGAKKIKPYVAKLIENGGYLNILKEEKEKTAKDKRLKQKEVIPPSEKIDKSTPEEDKAGLKLLRETVQNIRKRG